MPGRNTRKVFVADHFYHIYNRGWNKTRLFRDPSDYAYFETLLQRHLSLEPISDDKGREYTHMRERVDLNAYCLMPNHFHLLVYIREDEAATKLMGSIMTAYTMYFNRKYKRRGPLCESRFKAVIILQDDQLLHITRYIHLNKLDYKLWPWSSYRDYLNTDSRDWIETAPIMSLFANKNEYRDFVDDYAELQRERDSIKALLAGE